MRSTIRQHGEKRCRDGAAIDVDCEQQRERRRPSTVEVVRRDRTASVFYSTVLVSNGLWI